MAQILTGPTPSQMAAQQIGNPILESLQSLASMQIDNINKQKERSNIFAGLSTLMPPEQAQAMSFLPENMLKMIIPQMQKEQQKQQNLEAFRRSQQGVTPSATLGDLDPSTLGQQTQQPMDQVTPLVSLEPDTLGQEVPQGMEQLGTPEQFGQQQGDPTEEQQLAAEEAAGQKAFEDAYMLSNGNAPAALRAKEDVMGRMQKERLANKAAQQKQISEANKRKLKFDLVAQAKLNTNLANARKTAEASQKISESYRDSARAYDDVIRTLKTGKALTGMSYITLKGLGLEKSATTKETQVIEKVLAGLPIKALEQIPPGSARLSKVFDKVVDMHGSLANTREGLEAIGRTQKAKFLAGAEIEDMYTDKLQGYNARGESPPFNARKELMVSKEVEALLSKTANELQYIISESLEKEKPELKADPLGSFVMSNDGKQPFIKAKLGGVPTWLPYEKGEQYDLQPGS